ncbi:MAG: sulfite exporter TauE/SafE family protein [Deltaproteobacteria bacterium]|nr:sulfite exporter TauE/SafE family protein [Deltaproteobacteria bacterium]
MHRNIAGSVRHHGTFGFASWHMGSLVLLALLPGGFLFAHADTGRLTTARSIRFSAMEAALVVRYHVTIGNLPGRDARRALDQNQNGIIDPDEVRSGKNRVSTQIAECFHVLHDQRRVTPKPMHIKARLGSNRAGFFPLSWSITLLYPGAIKGTWRIDDRCTFPSPGLVEVIVDPGKDHHIEHMKTPKAVTDQGGLVQFAPGTKLFSVTFSLVPGPSRQTTPTTTKSLTSKASLLTRVLMGHQSLPMILAAALLALLLGAYHALSPGHGKTLVAAYLVGEQANLRHALILAGIVTFTHTFSIALLGLALFVVFGNQLPAWLLPYLSAISGLAIAAVGVSMLVRRPHDHHEHQHLAGDTDHHHEHQKRDAQGSVSMWRLLAIGVSGGLVPCPTALVVLLVAVSMGKTLLGLFLVAFFSLGLAAVLSIIGILVVKSKGAITKHASMNRLLKVLPRLSGAVVVIVGLGIAAGGLRCQTSGLPQRTHPAQNRTIGSSHGDAPANPTK